jgi:hypothetical protein
VVSKNVSAPKSFSTFNFAFKYALDFCFWKPFDRPFLDLCPVGVQHCNAGPKVSRERVGVRHPAAMRRRSARIMERVRHPPLSLVRDSPPSLPLPWLQSGIPARSLRKQFRRDPSGEARRCWLVARRNPFFAHAHTPRPSPGALSSRTQVAGAQADADVDMHLDDADDVGGGAQRRGDAMDVDVEANGGPGVLQTHASHRRRSVPGRSILLNVCAYHCHAMLAGSILFWFEIGVRLGQSVLSKRGSVPNQAAHPLLSLSLSFHPQPCLTLRLPLVSVSLVDNVYASDRSLHSFLCNRSSLGRKPPRDHFSRAICSRLP